MHLAIAHTTYRRHAINYELCWQQLEQQNRIKIKFIFLISFIHSFLYFIIIIIMIGSKNFQMLELKIKYDFFPFYEFSLIKLKKNKNIVSIFKINIELNSSFVLHTFTVKKEWKKKTMKRYARKTLLLQSSPPKI